jgi:hypothetical protein
VRCGARATFRKKISFKAFWFAWLIRQTRRISVAQNNKLVERLTKYLFYVNLKEVQIPWAESFGDQIRIYLSASELAN